MAHCWLIRPLQQQQFAKLGVMALLGHLPTVQIPMGRTSQAQIASLNSTTGSSSKGLTSFAPQRTPSSCLLRVPLDSNPQFPLEQQSFSFLFGPTAVTWHTACMTGS